jgi:hypothetical protein
MEVANHTDTSMTSRGASGLYNTGRTPAPFTSRDTVTVEDLLPGWSLDLAGLFR